MISIITPTYNRALLLPRMIKSVRAQSYDDWELLIMDDGSEDNTKEVVRSFEDDRIKFFAGKNSGAADKRNRGVKEAQGDFIVFLDSDDEVKPNWLAAFVDKIKEDNSEIVCCGLEKRDHSGKFVEEILPRDLGPFFRNIKANYLAGTILMKKEFFLNIGGYDTELRAGQHTDLVIRLSQMIFQKNIKLSNIFKALVIIHLHSGERIRHNYEAIYLGSSRTLVKYKELFKKHPDKHFDYLSVAGVNAMRTNRVKEGLKYFGLAQRVKPLNIKNLSRLFVGRISFLRKKIW